MTWKYRQALEFHSGMVFSDRSVSRLTYLTREYGQEREVSSFTLITLTGSTKQLYCFSDNWVCGG